MVTVALAAALATSVILRALKVPGFVVVSVALVTSVTVPLGLALVTLGLAVMTLALALVTLVLFPALLMLPVLTLVSLRTLVTLVVAVLHHQ